MENENENTKYDTWKNLHKAQLQLLKSVSVLKYKPQDFPLYWLLGDEGNRKLPTTTAIFSMGSAKSCPSKRLGLCKAELQGAKCYARKAECLYPLCLPYRNRQEKLWKNISAEEFAYQFLMINAMKRNPFDKCRFSESGDFHSQSCVDKLEKVARILKKFGVITYCYTSRSDLSFKHCRDLVVHGSGFTKEGIKGIFKIIPNKKEKVKNYSLCLMNCRKCNLCMKSTNVCIVKH